MKHIIRLLILLPIFMCVSCQTRPKTDEEMTQHLSQAVERARLCIGRSAVALLGDRQGGLASALGFDGGGGVGAQVGGGFGLEAFGQVGGGDGIGVE
jgi:hypothetical protein